MHPPRTSPSIGSRAPGSQPLGAWAMKGWEQIFFYDRDGNIIEVHQARE